MLAAASRAKDLLDDSAGLVADFLNARINNDGGFRGRSEQSDLYYTVFGIEGLIALDAPIKRDEILSYLQKFNTGQSLDLVHLACLVRCRADLSNGQLGRSFCTEIARRFEEYRSSDGGYNNSIGAQCGSVYGCFLALGAYQDMDLEMPNSTSVLNCVKSLRTADNAYTNEMSGQTGSTPATAAALTIMYCFGEEVDEPAVKWLLERCMSEGGFTASPNIPMPDLLSTATVLHALFVNRVLTDKIKEQCLDFIDSLWSNRGGFYGNWADKTLDCEYTYYGLLAIGHLNAVNKH